jgi:uncharacterized protein (TIGR00645 family)
MTRAVEMLLLGSRLLLIPFRIGLIIALLAVLLRYVKALWDFAVVGWSGSDKQVLVALLSLLELAFVVALTLIVILPTQASSETLEGDRDRPFLPAWMGQSDLEGSIRKLIGVVCAIVSLQLLKNIELIDELSDRYLAWLTGMLVAFVIAALLQSVADRLAAGPRRERTPR